MEDGLVEGRFASEVANFEEEGGVAGEEEVEETTAVAAD